MIFPLFHFSEKWFFRRPSCHPPTTAISTVSKECRTLQKLIKFTLIKQIFVSSFNAFLTRKPFIIPPVSSLIYSTEKRIRYTQATVSLPLCALKPSSLNHDKCLSPPHLCVLCLSLSLTHFIYSSLQATFISFLRWAKQHKILWHNTLLESTMEENFKFQKTTARKRLAEESFACRRNETKVIVIMHD